MNVCASNYTIQRTSAAAEAAERILARMVKHATFDSSINEFDVNKMAITFAYASGSFPVNRDLKVLKVSANQVLIPEGGAVIRVSRDDQSISILTAGDGWLAQLQRYGQQELFCAIAALDCESASRVAESVQSWGSVESAVLEHSLGRSHI